MLGFDKDFFTIKLLVKTGLPPLPGSVVRISGMLSDLNISQRQIAAAIGLDPILSSRILRLANSPIYALRDQVTSLEIAVSAVGNSSIAQALTISGVSDAFGRRVLSSPSGQKIWIHSLATAMASSEICRVKRLPGADDTFTCGLLHDIGKLILLRADTPLYVGILERADAEGDISTIETETFGFDHAELGEAAARQWGLPNVVCAAIKHHHQPMFATDDQVTPHVLHTADALTYLKASDAETDKLFEDDTVMTFGLEAAQFDEIWDTVSLRLKEVLASFS
jgi:putative nucleotidyltransferase with HDIG domain